MDQNGEDLVIKDPNIIRNIRHILTAYVYRNPIIGYVQGFNFIISRMIQVLPNKNDCFWTFSMLLENVLPIDYYSHLMGVRADSELFGQILFPEILPECY
jgi:hypothetical protein